MKFAAAILILFSLCFLSTNLQAAPLTHKQISKGVCRVTVTSKNPFQPSISRGTGTVVKKANGKYYIVTNGHVVGTSGGTATVEFFKDGRISKPIDAEIVWKYYEQGTANDIAILTIPENFGWTPQIIQLAPENTNVKKNDFIFGAGVPNGWWLQYWESRITDIVSNGAILHYGMPPIGGQSGSGILKNIKIGEEEYTRIVGLVTWRMGRNSFGGGVSLKHIFDMLHNRVENNVKIKGLFSNISSQEKCSRCKGIKGRHFYVVDKNGKREGLYCFRYYEEKLNQIKGSGKTIVFYDDSCLPWNRRRPKPKTDPNNGPPNIFPDDEKPSGPSEVDKLKKKIAELEKRLEKISGERDGLTGEKNRLESEIGKLKKQIENTNKEFNAISDRLVRSIDKNTKLEDSNKTLVTNNKELSSDNKDLKSRLKDRLNKLNIPFFSKFGGLGEFIAVIILAFGSGSFGATLWHKWGYPYMVKRFGFFPTKIVERIGKRKLARFFKKDQKKNPKSGYNNVEDTYKVLPPNILPENSNVTITEDLKKKEPVGSVVNTTTIRDNFVSIKVNEPPNKNDFTVQFFEQNNGGMDGCSVKDWAIKYSFYKRAVDKLTKEELMFNGRDNLQGQKTAADAINEWVTRKFLNHMSIEDLSDLNSIHHKAYLGVLYYKAVEKLANEEFPILNQKIIAHAIEKWIVQELSKNFN